MENLARFRKPIESRLKEKIVWNQSCGDPKSVVEPYVDQALHEAAAARPELVRVGPILEAPSCDVFENGGLHFTMSGRCDVAIAVARAYGAR